MQTEQSTAANVAAALSHKYLLLNILIKFAFIKSATEITSENLL